MFHRILHHQSVPANRRERVSPNLGLLLKSPISEGGVEIHLAPSGHIDWLLSAPTTQALSLFASAVERTFPGAGVNPELVPCALPGHPAEHWTFAWAKQRARHWNPLDITSEHDYADSLVTALSSPLARGHEVVVQVLFRATGEWEENLHLFTSPREKLLLYHQGLDVSMTGSYTKRIPTQWDQEQDRTLSQRLREPPYHVEFRAAAYGPEAKTILAYCVGDSYLKQYLSGNWRSLVFVKDRKKLEFDHAFRSDSLTTFVNGRERRNVSRSELSYILCPTWSRPNAALQYYVEDQELTTLREVLSSRNGTQPARPVPAVPTARQSVEPGQNSLSGSFVGPASSQQDTYSLPKFLPTSGPEASRRWIDIGRTFQGDPVFLSENPQWNHAAVLGGTGKGKSTLLLLWALEILLKKPTWTVVLIDPHGTLAEALKALLPPEIAADTIELDPSRLTYMEDGVEMVGLPLNILALPDQKGMDPAAFTTARDIIVDNLVYFVKNIWGPEVFGPQMEHNISSLASGLLEIPGTNLVDMYYALTNPQARARLAALVKTEGIRRFLLDELPRLTNVRYSQDRVSSTLNRLGKITNNQLLRQTLCQRVNPVDFRALLDHRLVIVNLSKTRIGNEASRFLGAMCFARLWLAILQRGVTGKQTCLFVDEFQDFVTPSIAHVLTEARKFGLHLVMANQYLEQIPDEIRSAVIANTDTWAFFRMGVEDSRRAAEISRPGRRGWTEETLRSLPAFRALFVQGNRLEMLTTYAPPKPSGDPSEIDAAVLASTRRYAAEETSAASPFLVDERHYLAVLEAIKESPKSFHELVQLVPFHRAEIWEAVLHCQQLGYTNFDRVTKLNVITELGRAHLRASSVRHVSGAEGEPHTALISHYCHYLVSHGVAAEAQDQRSEGSSYEDKPDFVISGSTRSGQEETWWGEAECSTLETKRGQVLKNLRKAMDRGLRCVFVVATRAKAEDLTEMLTKAFPSSCYGFDYIVCYQDGEGFTRFPDGNDGLPVFTGLPPCPSTSQSTGSVTTAAKASEHTEVTPSVAAPAGLPPKGHVTRRRRSEMEVLFRAMELVEGDDGLKFMVDGREARRVKDLIAAIPADKRKDYSPQKIGSLLGQLGFETARVREGGEKVTVYFPDDRPDGQGETVRSSQSVNP